MFEEIRIPVTTDASGNATVVDTHRINGYIDSIALVAGTFDAGVDVTVTLETPYLSIPVLTKLNFNSTQIVYPRAAAHAVADGSALASYVPIGGVGVIKIVVAQGGISKSGAFVISIVE